MSGIPAAIPSNCEKLPEARDIWCAELQRFPSLSLMSLDILGIPAASAAVERVFSTAGVATFGRSGRLSGENLETKVLLQRNRIFLDYSGDI